MISNFFYDLRTYSLSTAFYNVRFLMATAIASSLIREPMLFHAHIDCDADDCPVSAALDQV